VVLLNVVKNVGRRGRDEKREVLGEAVGKIRGQAPLLPVLTEVARSFETVAAFAEAVALEETDGVTARVTNAESTARDAAKDASAAKEAASTAQSNARAALTAADAAAEAAKNANASLDAISGDLKSTTLTVRGADGKDTVLTGTEALAEVASDMQLLKGLTVVYENGGGKKITLTGIEALKHVISILEDLTNAVKRELAKLLTVRLDEGTELSGAEALEGAVETARSALAAAGRAIRAVETCGGTVLEPEEIEFRETAVATLTVYRYVMGERSLHELDAGETAQAVQAAESQKISFSGGVDVAEGVLWLSEGPTAVLTAEAQSRDFVFGRLGSFSDAMVANEFSLELADDKSVQAEKEVKAAMPRALAQSALDFRNNVLTTLALFAARLRKNDFTEGLETEGE
jgi:hypothetical protein